MVLDDLVELPVYGYPEYKGTYSYTCIPNEMG